jgi:acyl-CoA thioesterase I
MARTREGFGGRVALPALIVGAFLLSPFGTRVEAQSPSTGQAPPAAQTPAAGRRPQLTPEQQAERQRAADEQLRNDWADLTRYRAANDSLAAPRAGEERVVYFGDSITDIWARYFPAMFPAKPYVGRGISGQTTPQMLVRFRQDVVNLKPKVVVILAGTNDIAGNTGPSTQAMIQDNLMSMTEIAKANGIRVVLASVLPASDFWWKRGMEPAPKIQALNRWIQDYATRVGVVYLDYYSAMADSGGGLPTSLSADGVHPTEAGYRVMAPLAERAIGEALRLQQ